MKSFLLCLPLLGLAPLAHFLAGYLEGAGILPSGVGLLLSAASMFVLPWVVSAWLALRPKITWAIRIPLFVCALVAQGVLLFTAVPPGATCEMMGTAHRLRRQFPPDQLRDCAEHLRQKRRDGSLTLGDRGKDHSSPIPETDVVVADSELPVSLRGRFLRVFIRDGRVPGDEQVFFALDERTGIVCDSRKQVREFFVCSMAEGVHAYRYQRL